jgi:hypothetical protein
MWGGLWGGLQGIATKFNNINYLEMFRGGGRNLDKNLLEFDFEPSP